MWIPQTEEEILQAVTSGTLQETSTFDAKGEIPPKAKDLAKDVAAMATDGGVLLFGVSEDEHKRPTVLTPISLAGASERITNIVQTCIADPPTIKITSIPTAADPAVGYLVIAVPLSPRAPHMVIKDGDNRFYGRTATGNIILGQGEVDRLYARRQQWEVDREALLNAAIAQAPLEPNPDASFLHLIARPVVADEGLLDRARKDWTPPTLLNVLLSGSAQTEIFPFGKYQPDLHDSVGWNRRPEGWFAYIGDRPEGSKPRDPSGVLDMQVNYDGSAYLFCGRAAERRGGSLLFYSNLVAGLCARFMSVVGNLYDRAEYFGPVDLGIAVTGLEGAIPDRYGSIVNLHRSIPFPRPNYRRSVRVSVPELTQDIHAVARKLVLRLIEAMYQGERDPFTHR